MVYTAEARRTTQAYQREQGQITALALGDMLKIWPAWNPSDLDATWEPVLVGLLGVAEHYYRLSSMRAAAYYARMRELSGVEGQVAPVQPEFDRQTATNNLMLLGPIFTKKAIANNRPRPMDTALVRVQGVMTALVLGGARETIQLTSDLDPRALGTRRITAGTCSWCLQLKAWGQDGKGPMVPGRSFKGHTNCRCLPEPGWEEIDPEALTVQEGGPFDPTKPFEQISQEGRDLRDVSSLDQPVLGQSVKDRYEQVVRDLIGHPSGSMRDYDIQKACKQRVQERVGTRLDGRFLGAKAQKLDDAVEEIRNMAYDYGAREAGASTGQQLTASLVGEWAGTSGDSSPLALALQKTAAKRYGLDFDPAVYRRGAALSEDTVERMNGLLERHGEVFDAFLEEMYRETQDLLDVMYPGATHVPLARGINIIDESAVAGIRYKVTTETTVTMNPMSSMSVQEVTATDFGNIQMRSLVPKERIIGTPLSGYGCLNEYEFVVVGAKQADPTMMWRT